MSSAEREFERLAIFPLPDVQLFPYALLPLHVFEPRYRELVRDCLAGDQRMAIATLEPGFESDYEGRPPVKPICGVGQMIAHNTLPDGRSNILLRGLARIRIVEELPPERAYRQVRAEVLQDDLPDGVDLAPALNTLVLLADQLSHRLPTGGETLRALARSQPNPGALVDALAAALVTQPEERQALLETIDVYRRVQRVTAHLGAILARFTKSTGPAN
jgi:Lon protease-like protein